MWDICYDRHHCIKNKNQFFYLFYFENFYYSFLIKNEIQNGIRAETYYLRFLFQFNGIWYGVQSDDGVSACEIFKLKPGKDALSYSLTTETRISTADHKYRTKFIETLTVIDPDFLAKMSVSPLPRKFFLKNSS